ncbi:hypothetical protein BV898_13319 [Hypsibius exemplaris]|uniref:Uncharacterized protein n=1 Tax=Hypsibius exemplaris TaxID=2072580 RepID=A0A1W0WBA8_HYPEX|nr:hypothetical protein BV898_13319 [Hypsibius exemplaris]
MSWNSEDALKDSALKMARSTAQANSTALLHLPDIRGWPFTNCSIPNSITVTITHKLYANSKVAQIRGSRRRRSTSS